ncbi:MAG: hypothetical protein IJ357_09190 [Oscillospiraceae bacterium]|nr:hypothetical protein [Oscillospiraceae bacterium]
MKRRIVALLTALCILSALLSGCTDRSALRAAALTKVNYPVCVKAPTDPNGKDFESKVLAHYSDRMNRITLPCQSEGLTDFLRASIPQILGEQAGENCIYSPLNVYLAMGMLAELTDGETRQEILDVMGCADLESLRTQAGNLWLSNYNDDGVSTRRLGSSLWLSDQYSFHQETLDVLAEHYYATAYRGTMGSADLNQALRDWLNQQTGNFLSEQVSDIELKPGTALALASTLYYKANWGIEFSEASTRDEVFHGLEEDLTCAFMHQSLDTNYYWGEHFTAVRMVMEDDSAMWFILPDEDYTVEDLLQETETMDFLLAGKSWEDKRTLTVHLSIPKFDVTSQLDLSRSMQQLGVTDAFDRLRADFSPTTSDTGLYVSQVRHDARVKIDEEGCEAASYVLMLMDATSAPPPEYDEVDFVLDQPFLFAIANEQGLPLFVGTVYTPA